jgi:hypothetical protein
MAHRPHEGRVKASSGSQQPLAISDHEDRSIRLSKDGGRQRQTIARRGYRLTVPIEYVEQTSHLAA